MTVMLSGSVVGVCGCGDGGVVDRGGVVLASHGDDRALEASERTMGEDALVAWGCPSCPRRVWGAGGAGAIFGVRVCLDAVGVIFSCPLWGTSRGEGVEV